MYLPLVVHRYQMEAAVKLLQSKNRVLFTLVSPVGYMLVLCVEWPLNQKFVELIYRMNFINCH